MHQNERDNPVYPCVYREHYFNVGLYFLFRGLSLCIQGTQDNKADSEESDRFIPVYTGNTDRDYYNSKTLAVYPCVYREHLWGRRDVFRFCGLSLCIQGTHLHVSLLQKCRRFIPVYTGNTMYLTLTAVWRSVYPCVYREHDSRST